MNGTPSAHTDCTFILNIPGSTVLTSIDGHSMAGGGVMADCYRKTNLVQKSRPAHVILEVHSRPGKSTIGFISQFLLQQGYKDCRTLLHWQAGAAKSGPVSTCS